MSIDEMIEFLSIVGEKGFLNENTVNARLTACRKFFDILEQDQKTVEYVRDHLDVIKAQFSNLNKDVAGKTVDEYARRVKLVLEDFAAWKEDRAGWERNVSQKQATRPADSERKAKSKTERSRVQEPLSTSAAGNGSAGTDTAMRTVEFPLRKGVDVKIVLPRDGITMAELKKLAWFLLPYATDFDPEVSPRETFPMLEQRDEIRNAQ